MCKEDSDFSETSKTHYKTEIVYRYKLYHMVDGLQK